MKVTVHESIGDIAAADWNRLAGSDYPFLKHEFLLAAEQSGSVSPETGWTPRHLTLSSGSEVLAAMLLYEKSHSWGEFVFDWAWAQAYGRAGFDYYPKLVSAVPFTPAPSRRLLVQDRQDRDTASALLKAAVEFAEDSGCSSLHLLFPETEELPALEAAGLKVRKDCQFHWHNHGYSDFSEFLATFSSKKRKKVRQDRRRVADAGIRFRRLAGGDIDAETWRLVYRLISMTFMQRGSLPYFTPGFFRQLGRELSRDVLVILAEHGGKTVAAAVFFQSDRALYGRYWGSSGRYNALHFETCYYQGIEYCIDTGKQLFEPGTQGEHKISRGFVPAATWSAHWLAHPEFFSAIGNYLDEEARHVERYMDAVEERSPYRADRRRKAH